MNPLKSLKPNQLLFPASVAFLCFFIMLGGDELSNLLRFDREAIQDKHQYWRLFTAHLTHLGWSHFVMNIAGLALVFAFFSSCLSTLIWTIIFFVSMLTVSVFIYWWHPDILWYVGLSGVLHALFVAGGIADIKIRKWEGITFCLIVLIKVSYEQIAGPLPGSEETAGGPVLVDAHFYGALTGLIIALPVLFRPQMKKAS